MTTIVGLAVLATFAWAGAPAASPPAAERGLSCDFGDVTLTNIPPGRAFELAARPVRVRNNGTGDVGIAFEADRPGPQELLPGYEPIPDPSWITFRPSAVSRVGPGRVAESILSIGVPAGLLHAGKAYQTVLYLHTTTETKGGVAVGLRPRLCFIVAAEGVEVASRGRRELKAGLGPPEIRSGGAFMMLPCQPLEAENGSNSPMRFEFGVRDPSGKAMPASQKLEEGYEPLPPEAVIVCNPRVLDLAPKARASVEVLVRLPLDMRHSGKRYQGFVVSRARSGPGTMNLLNEVFVDVPVLSVAKAAGTRKAATGKARPKGNAGSGGTGTRKP